MGILLPVLLGGLKEIVHMEHWPSAGVVGVYVASDSSFLRSLPQAQNKVCTESTAPGPGPPFAQA